MMDRRDGEGDELPSLGAGPGHDGDARVHEHHLEEKITITPTS